MQKLDKTNLPICNLLLDDVIPYKASKVPQLILTKHVVIFIRKYQFINVIQFYGFFFCNRKTKKKETASILQLTFLFHFS